MGALLPLFDEACRSTGPDLVGRNVVGDHRACTDDDPVADGHALHDPHTTAEPAVLADDDRRNECGLVHDQLPAGKGVVLVVDLAERTDLSVLADLNELL